MEPIFFKPFYEEKYWGGQGIGRIFGRKLPYGRVGESYEVSAREGSASQVRGGAYDGIAFSELCKERPQLFGGKAGGFPFVIKFVDAAQQLPVQVHPNDAVALEYEGSPGGKTEAWVILEAREDARLSVSANLADSAQLLDAVYDGFVEDTLIWQSVQAGDVFFLPAGTLHTVGGVTLYELQQPQSASYRVYDWGSARRIHPEKSAAAYDPLSKAGKVTPKRIGEREARLVSCDYFTLDSVDAKGGFASRADADFCVYTAMDAGDIVCSAGRFAFAQGDSFLIPAGMGEYEITGDILYRASAPRDRADV